MGATCSACSKTDNTNAMTLGKGKKPRKVDWKTTMMSVQTEEPLGDIYKNFSKDDAEVFLKIEQEKLNPNPWSRTCKKCKTVNIITNDVCGKCFKMF